MQEHLPRLGKGNGLPALPPGRESPEATLVSVGSLTFDPYSRSCLLRNTFSKPNSLAPLQRIWTFTICHLGGCAESCVSLFVFNAHQSVGTTVLSPLAPSCCQRPQEAHPVSLRLPRSCRTHAGLRRAPPCRQTVPASVPWALVCSDRPEFPFLNKHCCCPQPTAMSAFT